MLFLVPAFLALGRTGAVRPPVCGVHRGQFGRSCWSDHRADSRRRPIKTCFGFRGGCGHSPPSLPSRYGSRDWDPECCKREGVRTIPFCMRAAEPYLLAGRGSPSSAARLPRSMSCVYFRRSFVRALLNFGFFLIETTSARSWDLTVPSSRLTITRISPSAKIANSLGSSAWFRVDRGRRVTLVAMSDTLALQKG